jgi:hypothetical protein
MERALFIQPRHSYARPEGEGHIHLSAPLITAVAQLHAAGVQVIYRDENFAGHQEKIDEDVVGMNVVGAPGILGAIKIIQRVRSGAIVLLGGQFVDSLGDDFITLFSSLRDDVTILNGNREAVRREVFQIIGEIPSKEHVSSIPVWEQFSDEQMKAYLSREISFYLSQGCQYACTFCQAAKNRTEQYRDLKMAIEDLTWLAQKAINLGIKEFGVYLSNLDLFQTPDQLQAFMESVAVWAQEHSFTFKLRGLATVKSFLGTDDSVIGSCKKAGLVSVGFGVDGASFEAWRQTRKRHNMAKKGEGETDKCSAAIQRAAALGITPELLLVAGHKLGKIAASKRDLEASHAFAKEMIELYGAVLRFHVVKDLLPGADEWRDRKKNGKRIQELLEHPERFAALDYKALPSEISHPDPELRALVAEFCIAVCELDPLSSAQMIVPNTPFYQEQARKLGTTVAEQNYGKFDR